MAKQAELQVRTNALYHGLSCFSNILCHACLPQAQQTALDDEDESSSTERSLARKQLRKSLRRKESFALIAELMPGGLDQLDSLGSRKDSLLSLDPSEAATSPSSPRRRSVRPSTSESGGRSVEAAKATVLFGLGTQDETEDETEETVEEPAEAGPATWQQLAVTVVKQGGALGFAVKSRLEPEVNLHNFISKGCRLP